MRLLKKLSTAVLLWSLLAGAETSLAAQTTTQTLRIESFQGRDVVAGEILVRFRDGLAISAQTSAAQDPDILSAQAISRTGTLHLRSRSRNTAALLQAYQNRLDVFYAEPNYIWHATDIPNDALFSQQWGLRNSGQPVSGVSGTAGADIRAAQAWDITEGSRSVVVGLVDTGVDYTHPDLAGNIWTAPAAFTVTIAGQSITCAAGTHGFNAITRTCDPVDDVGHGTHVAGILAGSGNNGAGISGVSRIGSIMGLKFLSATGGTTADAIAAIEFAVQVKAIFPSAANIRILNNSWGGNNNSFALRDALSSTLAADMLLVTSSGNSATSNDLTPHYPSGYDLPNIVGVASTNSSDGLSLFSNWGATTVHLGAPGEAIMSTLPSGTYGIRSGTSMATPMVSGAAALVLSACSLTTSQLRQNILGNIDPATALAGKTTSGGRLNVYRSLTACVGATPPGFRVSVTPGSQTTEANGTVNLTVTVSSLGGFTGTVGLAAAGLPAGVNGSFNPAFVAGGSGAATLTLTANIAAQAGTYFIPVTGTSGSLTSSSSVELTIGAAISLRQTINGALTTSDRTSSQDTERRGDFYRLNLNSTTEVTIDLKSRVFDTYLYLLSEAGNVLYEDDSSGTYDDARITATLAAGTYSIEVTSLDETALGAYALSVNTPTLATITPPFGSPGTSVNLTVTGTRLNAPLTMSAGDIGVSGILAGSNLATAVLNIAGSAVPGPREITVTGPEGTSNPVTFVIAQAIAAGQRISGSLASTDPASPANPYRYADLYRLTLAVPTAVTIDLRSTAFPPELSVMSPEGTVTYTGTISFGSSSDRLTTTLPAGTHYIAASSIFERDTGAYDLSINLPVLNSINRRFWGANSSTTVTLTGANFVAPMTVAAGSGVTVSNVTVSSTTSATALFTIGSSAVPGPREVTVTTAAGISNAQSFRVTREIPVITVGQTLSEALTSTDEMSMDLPRSFADLYQLTLASAATVTIDLQSAGFDPYLYLQQVTGSTFAADDNGGGETNARLTRSLAAGTYFIGVSSVQSAALGAYSLSVSTTITLTSVSPRFGSSAFPIDITLSGTGLIEPLTIDAGPGITVSDVYISTSTSARARLTIAPDASAGARNLRVTTPATSNAVTFTVYGNIPSITLGQTVNGTLSTADLPSPQNASLYGDMYRITVPTAGDNVISLNSAAFDSYIYVLSSTGAILYTGDNFGGTSNVRIEQSFNPGMTYFLLVTSASPGLGDYSLSVLPLPVFYLPAPDRGTPGSVVGVRLSGRGFAAPMTVVAAGEGVSFSNIDVLNDSSALATVTIAANATLGNRFLTATTPFGNGGGSVFRVVAAQSSQLYFPKSLLPEEMSGMGFAVTNPSGADASVTFTLNRRSVVFGQSSVLATTTQTVPARGQFARLGSELFPGTTEAGWVTATSPTVGLQGFWVGGDFATFTDGAAAPQPAPHLLFPLITSQSEINIVATRLPTVTFNIYDAAGQELAPAVTQNVWGILTINAAALFPSVDFDTNTVSIRASASDPLVGTVVTRDFPVAPSWTALNGLDASLSLFELNFAHVPTGPMDGGPAWLSVVGVTNLSASAQNAVFTFTPLTGSPVQVTRNIAAGGTLRENVHTLFGFSPAYREGWIKVTGTGTLNGFLAYGYTLTKGAAVVPAEGVARPNLLFSHVAMGPGWGTGVALLNTTSTLANVQVYVMRADGTLVGGADNVPTASFTLAPGTKIARLLEELVPAANANDGFVFVRTTNNVPLIGLELFFTRDIQIIANVAAGSVDASITYSPPAPSP